MMSICKTIETIDFCCHRDAYSDAYTLLRKCRDDLMQYLFVLNVIQNKHGLTDEEAEKFTINSKFMERFPELSLFYRLSSPLDSEMICIFPYFCPCEESAREIREFFIKHCSPLYQEVLRNPALLFLLSERRYSLWY